VLRFAHVLLGKPVSTFPGHALRMLEDVRLRSLKRHVSAQQIENP
jgi:hypothetical protein